MGLGLRATARELGISHVGLLSAWKNGRVKKLDDGTFDVEECRRSLEINSNPGKQASARTQQRSPAEPIHPVEPVAAAPLAPTGSPEETEGGQSYNEACRQKEWIKVENERLNLAERKRELAPVGEVNAWVAGMILSARDILLRIGPELRDKLAQETDPIRCEEMVMEEIHRSLRELAEYG